ncbi:unnamed protein product [Closterium sp. Naga37s-1]|nr:unnamed protein product [Closterium sp. Naga37s-1]
MRSCGWAVPHRPSVALTVPQWHSPSLSGTHRPSVALTVPQNLLRPPGYYFRAGVGEGLRKWHVFLAGGGWCATRAECVARSKTYLGSSRMYPADPSASAYADVPWMKPGYDAILSANASANPAVHEWNLVRVLYCDGGGYAGTKGRVKLADGTSIYLDGWNVFRAVVQDLRANREMDSPSHILLSGSSAGGQAVVNLCDWLAASFPNATTRCLVDSGFFMDAKDRYGKHGFRSLAQSITALHRPHNPYCAFDTQAAKHACPDSAYSPLRPQPHLLQPISLPSTQPMPPHAPLPHSTAVKYLFSQYTLRTIA